MRMCINCGKEKPIEEFPWYASDGYGYKAHRWRKRTCRTCQNIKNKSRDQTSIRIKIRRSQIKRKMELFKAVVIKYGGKCRICGRSRPILTFVFHHTNGRTSGQTFGRIWYKQLLECGIKKDVWLLCANCHLILHRTKWNTIPEVRQPTNKQRTKKGGDA